MDASEKLRRAFAHGFDAKSKKLTKPKKVRGNPIPAPPARGRIFKPGAKLDASQVRDRRPTPKPKPRPSGHPTTRGR